MKARGVFAAGAILLCAALSIGCGGSFQGAGSGGASAQGGGVTPVPPPVVDPVTQANTEIATLNTNITNLNTTITSALSQLNLVTIASLQTGTGGSQTSNPLSVSLGKALDGVVTGVQDVYTEIGTINSDITTEIGKLNSSVPADAKEITELQTLQTDLANFKAKVNTAVLNLASKMASLESTVNNDIANMNQSSLLTVVVEAYWVPVESQIQTHHDTLVNLAS